jgi:alpha-beta hydrolase superfamily lysophospholipase
MDDCHTVTVTATDGTSLFLRHWATETPIATLLIVHGFGEHSGRYSDFGTYFAFNNIDTFAIDLRGHGQSAGKRGVIASYDDYRTDLRALIDYVTAREPKHPVILFGHSMGGGIVLDHTLAPDPIFKAAIASAPLIAPADAVPGALRAVAKFIAKIAPNATMKQAISGDQISSVPNEQSTYENDPHNHDRIGFRTAVEIIERGEALAEHAAGITLPLLMLHAKGDQLTDFAASEAFGVAAGADFRAFERVQHEMHNDTSRTAIYQAILDFIGAQI